MCFLGEMPMDTGKSKKSKAMFDDIVAGEQDETKLLTTYGVTYGRMYKSVAHCMDLVKRQKKEPYQRNERFKVCIWFGLAGAGKTWDAEQQAIDGGLSMWKADMDQIKKGWFNGYNGEEVILFDDYRGSVMQFHALLNFIDRPKRFPVKGGYVENTAKFLFITSPEHPVNWYKTFMSIENDWNQLSRRINNIYCAETVEGVHTVNEVTDRDRMDFKKEEIFTEYQPKFIK